MWCHSLSRGLLLRRKTRELGGHQLEGLVSGGLQDEGFLPHPLGLRLVYQALYVGWVVQLRA